MGDKGIVASTAGLAILLNEGIGDTIRVSLTPEPGAPREREVEIAQQVLQSMGLRSFLPQVSRLPGLRPDDVDVLPGDGPADPGLPQGPDAGLARDATRAPRSCASRSWAASSTARASRSTPTSGSACPGTFEEPVAPVFIDGRLDRTLRGDGLVAEFIDILEDYVARPVPGAGRAVAASAGLSPTGAPSRAD